MKIDEFRKFHIKNFPKSERGRYEKAIESQGDSLLFIMEEARGQSDELLTEMNSLHYTGRGYLDTFWNTLLNLGPVITNSKTARKPRKKVATKKKATTRKRTAVRKAAPKKKTGVRKKTASKKLIEF